MSGKSPALGPLYADCLTYKGCLMRALEKLGKQANLAGADDISAECLAAMVRLQILLDEVEKRMSA